VLGTQTQLVRIRQTWLNNWQSNAIVCCKVNIEYWCIC